LKKNDYKDKEHKKEIEEVNIISKQDGLL